MPISARQLSSVISTGTLPQFLVSLRLVEYKVSPGYSHSPSRRVTIIVYPFYAKAVTENLWIGGIYARSD